MTTEHEAPVTGVLRRVIRESGKSLLAIQKATAVSRQSLALFMRHKRRLRSDAADALATYFGMELVPKRKGRGGA